MDTLLKKLTLYVNADIASQIEKESFMQFIEHLKSSKRIRFIYRGESNLYEQYNSGLENISVLSQHIFILGVKARVPMEEKLKKYDKNTFSISRNSSQKKRPPACTQRESTNIFIAASFFMAKDGK